MAHVIKINPNGLASQSEKFNELVDYWEDEDGLNSDQLLNLQQKQVIKEYTGNPNSYRRNPEKTPFSIDEIDVSGIYDDGEELDESEKIEDESSNFQGFTTNLMPRRQPYVIINALPKGTNLNHCHYGQLIISCRRRAS